MSNKPTIEAIINTVALALTAWGVQAAMNGGTLAHVFHGYFAIVFGLSIEWFKYHGRQHKWWK